MPKKVVELAAPKPPKPAQVDKLIQAYYALESEIDADQAKLDSKAQRLAFHKAELLDLVERFGYQHSEKTKRLAGIRHAAKSTTGVRTVVIDAEVDKLRAQCETSGVEGLRDKLFSSRTVYQLVTSPSAVLRGLPIAAKLIQQLDAAIAKCFDQKTNKPSLSIEYVETVEAA